MAIVEIESVTKEYESGTKALNGIDLSIERGELLALLGPNGAGKTTLISAICGITTITGGQIRVAGHDVVKDFRAARALVGLVPQELTLEPFEKVINTVRFSRGLFGKPKDDSKIEDILQKLSLLDKRDAQIRTLSGGMKRRVLIAKALSHEPQVLFLDEPSAGVDVGLRKGMWDIIRDLRAAGVTIILTTHYIEEAEEMADRIAIINKGKILLVQEKQALMKNFGQKQLDIDLRAPIKSVPDQLSGYGLTLSPDGSRLSYVYDTGNERTGIARLMSDLQSAGLGLRDLQTRQSSLEEIFVGLVGEDAS